MVSRKFSILEQIWMQVSFHGIWILGFVSILQFNGTIAVSYLLLFPCIGVLFFIMHLQVCPGCPHINAHNSCVQLPPFITKKIITNKCKGKLRLYEKIIFFIVLYGVFFVPLYWVLQIEYVWILYVFFGLMHYTAYYFRLCKKCLNIICPQNMNPERH